MYKINAFFVNNYGVLELRPIWQVCSTSARENMADPFKSDVFPLKSLLLIRLSSKVKSKIHSWVYCSFRFYRTIKTFYWNNQKLKFLFVLQVYYYNNYKKDLVCNFFPRNIIRLSHIRIKEVVLKIDIESSIHLLSISVTFDGKK